MFYCQKSLSMIHISQFSIPLILNLSKVVTPYIWHVFVESDLWSPFCFVYVFLIIIIISHMMLTRRLILPSMIAFAFSMMHHLVIWLRFSVVVYISTDLFSLLVLRNDRNDWLAWYQYCVVVYLEYTDDWSGTSILLWSCIIEQ